MLRGLGGPTASRRTTCGDDQSATQTRLPSTAIWPGLTATLSIVSSTRPVSACIRETLPTSKLLIQRSPYADEPGRRQGRRGSLRDDTREACRIGPVTASTSEK